MVFEIKLIEFLQAGRTPFFDLFFQIISMAGSYVGIVCLGIFLFIFRRKLCFWYLISYGFVYLAVEGLKEVVARPRPFNCVESIANIGDAVTGFSFPSGHAAAATTIAIFLVYFLLMHIKKRSTKICVVVSAVLFVGFVCLSRLYLGKHYLTDVVAGVLVAAVICTVLLILMHFVQKKRVKKNED